MSVTDGDRRTAGGLVSFYRGLLKGGAEDPVETGELAAAIAAALAEEREKARAPFLALADHWAGLDTARVHAAEQIRRAAEENE